MGHGVCSDLSHSGRKREFFLEARFLAIQYDHRPGTRCLLGSLRNFDWSADTVSGITGYNESVAGSWGSRPRVYRSVLSGFDPGCASLWCAIAVAMESLDDFQARLSASSQCDGA
jgi:hypothetical protein